LDQQSFARAAAAPTMTARHQLDATPFNTQEKYVGLRKPTGGELHKSVGRIKALVARHVGVFRITVVSRGDFVTTEMF
jgi:hypothetical protein